MQALIGAERGVAVDNIFLGNGSDEAVDLLMRVFVRPERDSVLLNPPTYGMYPVYANANGAKIISVPLTPDFQLQPDKVRPIPCRHVRSPSR